MPSFTRKNGRYFVSYITGPSHVLLGLAFDSTAASPTVHREPRRGESDQGTLDESKIREAVVAGAAEAGVQLHPVEITYVENDSPRYDLYQYCAYLLAKRVAAGEPFTEAASGAAEHFPGAEA